MKENNNIVIVLDALGEKIGCLELELQCEKYKSADLEKQAAELKAELVERSLMIADKDRCIAELEKEIADYRHHCGG